MAQPRAILFDLGYTLLRHHPAGPRLYQGILAEQGFPVDEQQMADASQLARQFYVDATRSGRDFEVSMEEAVAFWDEYNTLILERVGVPRERQRELSELIYTTAWQPEAWTVFPETVPTLQDLRARGFRMAVVSNFVDTLQAVCALHQLTPYFDTIISSVEARAMKPDPRIFRIATRRLGVDAADAWHIGDNYWADVLGARAAGITPVLVDRDNACPRPDCMTVTSLTELLELLDQEAAA
jgi:putative hydrolase of the HAD superfamily